MGRAASVGICRLDLEQLLICLYTLNGELLFTLQKGLNLCRILYSIHST